MTSNAHRAPRLLKSNGRSAACWLLLCSAPFSAAACSSGGALESSNANGVAELAVVAADCGYSVNVSVTRESKTGFRARVRVSSTNGMRLPSTGFSVWVDGGAATLAHVGHGTFEQVENGYLLSTVTTSESPEDLLADGDSASDPDVLAGRAYRFHLSFHGAYTTLSAVMNSSGGVKCDQTAPSLKLVTSSEFFTANGTLSLSAQASDNVGVSKVVFAQDGVQIATVRRAPFTLNLPVTNALNGRHRYSATAYDLGNNQASETKRVLVSIGNKFFGTAATTAADYPGLLAHFNQVTPGNAGKWGSVEATRDQMNWSELDTAYTFAKNNHVRFKFHTLIWGQQQPSWLAALPVQEQLAEIEQWMSAVAARYPNIDLVDVVNEPLHAPPAYTAALGGAGTTGWDWVIKSFDMARAHFPNAELLLNDYSILSMTSATRDYLDIAKLLSDRGLIDGISEQGHFYERAPDPSVLTTNLNSFIATGLPLYISELDLNQENDAQQANRMKELFTTFWSKPSVLGITHWGYLQGNMWQPNAYLQRSDGTLRPALTWIDCYRAGGTNCTVPAYVPPPRLGDANGLTLEAEDYDSAHALLPAGNVLAYASDGSWFSYEQVALKQAWTTLSVSYAQGGTSTNGLSVHLDSLDNAPVASVSLPPTGGWGTLKTVSIPWSPLNLQKKVFVRFNGGGANVDKLVFSAPAAAAKNVVANGTFESGTSGWYTWNGGVVSAATDRAHGGTQSLLVASRANNAPAATDLTSVVKAASNYPLSLWASIRNLDGSSQAIHVTQATSCRAADGTVSTSYAWIAGPVTLSGGAPASWSQLSGTVSVPNCTLTQLQLFVEGAAGADLYVDDVQVLDNSAASSNLIADGTFESGQGAWGGWGSAALTVTTSLAHAGTSSLLGSGMQPNGALARDIAALVTAGKRYQATAWVSVGNVAAGSGSVKFQTVQRCNGATSDSYPWLAGATVANGAWTQVSGTVDLSACTTAEKLQLFVGADSGDLYVDDVTLTPIP
ncbi:MAG TPA: endo-1,4-beta-xylanase [Polyangiaceae bacterium]|nr:endo-1,4-beta-xylanase [Polyangiaceae bacterium]